MAKRVTFGPKRKARKGGDTSFNFGLNAMTGKQRRAYRNKAGKGGGS